MAWHRCAGEAGAARDIAMRAGEPGRRDTLVVSWDPGGVVWDDFIAVYGGINFYDAAGDSLLPFWNFGNRGTNRRGVLINLEAPADTARCPSVWRSHTEGGTQYDYYGQHGRLRYTFYVPMSQAYPLHGGRRHHVANVVLSHQLVDSLAGAQRPIVLELAFFNGYFGTSYEKEYTSSPDRYLTINDPTGEHLRRFLERGRGARPKTWKPPPHPGGN
jgi:hypothetical protein